MSPWSAVVPHEPPPPRALKVDRNALHPDAVCIDDAVGFVLSNLGFQPKIDPDLERENPDAHIVMINVEMLDALASGDAVNSIALVNDDAELAMDTEFHCVILKADGLARDVLAKALKG